MEQYFVQTTCRLLLILQISNQKKNLIILRYQIIETFTNGGILLRKWVANHPALIPKSHEPNLNVSFDKDPYTKTLGFL
jgi:hypothetical protein